MWDKIKVGDDIAVGLIVERVSALGVWAKLKSGAVWFVPYEDIKTHRPGSRMQGRDRDEKC